MYITIMSIIICNEWTVNTTDSGEVSLKFFDTTRHMKYSTGSTKSVTPTSSDNPRKAPKPVTMHHHSVILNKKSIYKSSQFDGYQATPKGDPSCCIALSLGRREREAAKETPQSVKVTQDDDEIVTQKTKVTNFLQEQNQVEVIFGLAEPEPIPESTQEVTAELPVEPQQH